LQGSVPSLRCSAHPVFPVFPAQFAFSESVTYFSGVLYFGEKEEDFGAVGREGIAGGPFLFPP
jgi:hypothetical protein